jgi:hydrogenase maturation protease
VSRALVIGIGNVDRGDDGVGRAVARWLRGKLARDVEIVEHDGEATSLLAQLENVACVYLIDACRSGAAAGTVTRFDVSAVPLPRETFGMSTHGMGLADAVELARALGQLPARCIVYAIEGGAFEPGAALTPAVSAAIDEAGRRLADELSSTTGEPMRHA